MSIFSIITSLVRTFLGDRAELAAEIVALRHQLAALWRCPSRSMAPSRSPSWLKQNKGRSTTRLGGSAHDQFSEYLLPDLS